MSALDELFSGSVTGPDGTVYDAVVGGDEPTGEWEEPADEQPIDMDGLIDELFALDEENPYFGQTTEEPLQYSRNGQKLRYSNDAHAPKGYTKEHPLKIGGNEYIGGQFIPGSVIDKATPEEKKQLEQSQKLDDALEVSESLKKKIGPLHLAAWMGGHGVSLETAIELLKNLGFDNLVGAEAYWQVGQNEKDNDNLKFAGEMTDEEKAFVEDQLEKYKKKDEPDDSELYEYGEHSIDEESVKSLIKSGYTLSGFMLQLGSMKKSFEKSRWIAEQVGFTWPSDPDQFGGLFHQWQEGWKSENQFDVEPAIGKLIEKISDKEVEGNDVEPKQSAGDLADSILWKSNAGEFLAMLGAWGVKKEVAKAVAVTMGYSPSLLSDYSWGIGNDDPEYYKNKVELTAAEKELVEKFIGYENKAPVPKADSKGNAEEIVKGLAENNSKMAMGKWFGANGYSFEYTKAAMAAMGYQVSDASLKTFMNMGKNWKPNTKWTGAPVIKLTDEQEKAIADFVNSSGDTEADSSSQKTEKTEAASESIETGVGEVGSEANEVSEVGQSSETDDGMSFDVKGSPGEEELTAKQAAEVGAKPDPAIYEHLEYVQKLGGSGDAALYKLGETKYSMKSARDTPTGNDHLRNEQEADEAYKAAGIPVVASSVFEKDGKLKKLSNFVEGEDYGSWLKHASASQKAKVKKQLQKGFAVDALLANWDVIGMAKDNIKITPSGQAVRIDNGGSMAFRAQGKHKDAAWNEGNPSTGVNEINSLRSKSQNAAAHSVFGTMSDWDVAKNIIQTLDTPTINKMAEAAPSQANMIRSRGQNMIVWAAGYLSAHPEKPVKTKKEKAAQNKVEVVYKNEKAEIPQSVVKYANKSGYGSENVKLSVNEYAPDWTRNYIPKITVTGARAIKSYTGSAYYSINHYLRGETSNNPNQATIKGLFKLFHDFNGDPKEVQKRQPMVVTRKIKFVQSLHDELVQGLEKKKPVVMRGFISASTKPSVWDGDMRFVFKTRKGIDSMPFSSHQSESEILLPHLAEFKVVKAAESAPDIWPGWTGHVYYLEDADL